MRSNPIPVVPTRGQRYVAKASAGRLLVRATSVHTAAGHHVTEYTSWRRWAQEHGVAIGADPVAAAATISRVVASWPATTGRRLLPW